MPASYFRMTAAVGLGRRLAMLSFMLGKNSERKCKDQYGGETKQFFHSFVVVWIVGSTGLRPRNLLMFHAAVSPAAAQEEEPSNSLQSLAVH